MERRLSIDEDVAAGRKEEEKRQRAYSHVSVGSLSLLLVGLMALMACSHRDAPLWLVSELCAVLCLLLYLWAYHLTQNLTAVVVPVEALVFSFPLVFGAGFLAALLAVAIGPVAGGGAHVLFLWVLPRRIRALQQDAGRAQEACAG